MRRLRAVLANAALALAASVLVLGVLEVAFRVLMRGRGGAEDGAADRYVEFDERLGWRKKPGAHVLFRRNEYVVNVDINGLGQRDRERVYDRAPGSFRVLALGDSFLEGYTVPLESTVTQRLEAELAKPGCPVEVLNTGTAGYSTDQEYLFYKDEGVRYEPNVVALFFYYNDIEPTVEDNYYGRLKPRFVISADGGIALKRETLPPPGPKKTKAAAEEDAGAGLHSALWTWTVERLRRGQPGLYNRLAALGLWDPLEANRPRSDLGVYRREPPSWAEPAWQQVAAIVGALKQEVEAHGARLVIVYIPNPMETSERSRELTRLAYGMQDADWDVERVARRLGKVAARFSLPLVDLREPLRAAEGRASGPYLVIDGHWNALGHDTAARAIAKRLREEKLVPGCAG
jgi:hypothetical protein